MKGRVSKGALYEGLRKLVRGLRTVASGAVVDRTLTRATAYLQGRVTGELGRHVKSGTALATGRVTVNATALDVTLQRYYRYIPWSFKKGIPRSAIDRIIFIAAQEYERAMKGA